MISCDDWSHVDVTEQLACELHVNVNAENVQMQCNIPCEMGGFFCTDLFIKHHRLQRYCWWWPCVLERDTKPQIALDVSAGV